MPGRKASFQAERQLVLIAAATASRRDALAGPARRLAVGVEDWALLAEVLRMRKLLTTLGPRMLELCGEAPGEAFAEAVEQALQAARRQSGFLQLVTARVTAMLAEAGIRCAALKGPVLAEALYGDAGRRLSSDIDLLVPPGQLQAAVQVVRGMGYSQPNDPVQEDGLPLLHFALAHEQDTLPPVELHWRIHWYEADFARERLLPNTPSSAEPWRAQPRDELAALLLFYARDGFVDLRMASDIAAWWDLYGERLPAGAMDELLSAHPALGRAIKASAAAAERVVGIPAARLFSRPLRLGRRERVAVRLANPNPRSSQSQIYADMALIDGLLTPPGGMREFVRRQVLLPSDVLEQQARHGGRSRARSSLAHGAAVLGRYALTLARLARAGSKPANTAP